LHFVIFGHFGQWQWRKEKFLTSQLPTISSGDMLVHGQTLANRTKPWPRLQVEKLAVSMLSTHVSVKQNCLA
jgi:hypothetical protein